MSNMSFTIQELQGIASLREGEIIRREVGEIASFRKREEGREVYIPHSKELEAIRSGASLLLTYEIEAMELRKWEYPDEYWWDPTSIRVYARVVNIQQVNSSRWHVVAEAVEGLPITGHFEVDLIRKGRLFFSSKKTPFPIE